MFSQQPEIIEESNSNSQTKHSQSTAASCKILQNQRRRRKKKPNKKNKQLTKELQKKKSRFAATMSSWAESFTVAATWQLKHQLAHWKARAKALEYENKVLHDVIRRNCLSVPQGLDNADLVSDSEPEQSNEETVQNEDEGEEAFELSEEFIQFVLANTKYKEEARIERERLKAEEEEKERLLREQLQSVPVLEDNTQRLKDLYGDQWQRIGALEMSLQSQFIEETDRERTTYWPVIPFNFNY